MVDKFQNGRFLGAERGAGRSGVLGIRTGAIVALIYTILCNIYCVYSRGPSKLEWISHVRYDKLSPLNCLPYTSPNASYNVVMVLSCVTYYGQEPTWILRYTICQHFFPIYICISLQGILHILRYLHRFHSARKTDMANIFRWCRAESNLCIYVHICCIKSSECCEDKINVSMEKIILQGKKFV